MRLGGYYSPDPQARVDAAIRLLDTHQGDAARPELLADVQEALQGSAGVWTSGDVSDEMLGLHVTLTGVPWRHPGHNEMVAALREALDAGLRVEVT